MILVCFKNEYNPNYYYTLFKDVNSIQELVSNEEYLHFIAAQCKDSMFTWQGIYIPENINKSFYRIIPITKFFGGEEND